MKKKQPKNTKSLPSAGSGSGVGRLEKAGIGRKSKKKK
jgi:hypothetical protein